MVFCLHPDSQALPSLEPYSASEVRTIGAFKYYLYMSVCIYIYITLWVFFIIIV